jgi:hypothetical protein
VAGSCEQGDKCSDCVKVGEFIEFQREHLEPFNLNLTVKASVSVVTAYYVRVSDAAVVSVFISAETETSSNCRRCLAMDVRFDPYNQAFRRHPTMSSTLYI